jgi:transposase-like protein
MHIQVSLIVDLDATSDLATMEQQIQAAGHESMRQALGQGIRQWEQEHRSCPRCGSQNTRTEGTVSRRIQALFGSLHLARRRFRCQQCFHRFCPANQLLEPMCRGRVSPALADAACLAGSSWPYRQAAQVLARLSGAHISAEEVRLLTNRSGQVLAQRQEQTSSDALVSSEKAEITPPLTTKTDRTILGLDGGWVPCREQRGGMEGKVAVVASHQALLREPSHPSQEMTWYELKKYLRHHRSPGVRRSRWMTRRYAATFASSSIVGRQAAKAVERLRLGQQEQVVIADGAQWIKTETQKHFPQATCILDWPHLWRTMAKAVRAVATQREAEERWLHQQSKRLGNWLWKGQVQRASALLLSWQKEHVGQRPIKSLQAALTYLENQHEWIGNYEKWKQQGYPVGSGIIERAVAVVINRRMKRRGMSWLRPNATSIVALRVAFLNEEWLLPTNTRFFP